MYYYIKFNFQVKFCHLLAQSESGNFEWSYFSLVQYKPYAKYKYMASRKSEKQKGFFQVLSNLGRSIATMLKKKKDEAAVIQSMMA